MGLFPVQNNTSLHIENSDNNQLFPQFEFKIKPLTKTAKTPQKALENDNGYDLFLSSLTDKVEGEDEQFSFETHTTGCSPVYDEQGKVVGIDIRPGGMAKLPLGFAAAFNPAWGGFVFDKSGVGSKGIKYLGGVIEGNFRGHWMVMLANIKTADEFCPNLINRIPKDYKDNTVRFLHGQKIAQVCFLLLARPTVRIVEELDETERSKAGWGSTGSF